MFARRPLAAVDFSGDRRACAARRSRELRRAVIRTPRTFAAPAMPADNSALLQTAQRQFNAGNYSAAITTLQSAVTQNSSSGEAYYWLGRTYYEIRDYDNAITAGEKSVALDPKNSVYHQWLGRIYGGKADRDRSFSYARKVKKEFEAAVELNPDNLAARRDLEEYDLQAPWVVGGNKDEAKAQVDAITARDPVAGHLARAVYDMDGAKKPDLAEKEYREVLAAKPAKIEPYLEVIAFFQQQNKPADMETAIQAAALVAPNDPRLGYWRGAALTLAGSNLGGRREIPEGVSGQHAGSQRLAFARGRARLVGPRV